MIDDELRLAAYNQNSETFRSLNTLMWQIPLIAMTLTGGLWFGVSAANASDTFKVGLLCVAVFGNVSLAAVLHRLRYVIGCYLDWLEQSNPDGHVGANGTGFLTQSKVVRTVFQSMLMLAAMVSACLIFNILCKS